MKILLCICQFHSVVNVVKEPHWSLNGVGVEVGAHTREYWLGAKEQVQFNDINNMFTQNHEVV